MLLKLLMDHFNWCFVGLHHEKGNKESHDQDPSRKEYEGPVLKLAEHGKKALSNAKGE